MLWKQISRDCFVQYQDSSAWLGSKIFQPWTVRVGGGGGDTEEVDKSVIVTVEDEDDKLMELTLLTTLNVLIFACI